jgi:C4-dicarboxylate-specific signal transduction histidine kinase
MRTTSLSMQMLLGIPLVMAVGLVSLTLVTSHRQTTMYLKMMERNATEISQNIAIESAHYLVVDDYAALESFLVKAAQLPNITRIQICSDKGISFGEVERSNEKNTVIAIPNPQPLTPPASEHASIQQSADSMWIWQPIIAGGLLGWAKVSYSLTELSQMQRDIWQNSAMIGFLWIAASVLLTILVLRRPARAIRNLSNFARQLPVHRGDLIVVEHFAEEIQQLGESLNYASSELRTMEDALLAEQERLRIALREEELAETRLKELNRTLEERVHEELNRSRGKDIILLQQARHAMMGEIMMNIAHQWRQPLNAIGARVQEMAFLLECGEIGASEVKGYTADVMDTLVQMSRTIDRFRHFYHPRNTTATTLMPFEAVREAVAIVEDSYREQGIVINLEERSQVPINCTSGDFSQCILIIMSNARDAIMEHQVSGGRIEIMVEVAEENGKNRICITDNGGGIPENLMERIFDPYVTTKFQSQGVGLGLFMAHQIVEKRLNGNIRARNTAIGAEFILEV